MKRSLILSAVAMLAVPAIAQAKPHGQERHAFAFSMMSGGRLGLQIQSMGADLRKYFGAPEDAGVLVASVEADSPAAKAGFQAGDVVVDVDGDVVDDPSDLTAKIFSKESGATVKIGVIREKHATTLTATLRDRTVGKGGEPGPLPGFEGNWKDLPPGTFFGHLGDPKNDEKLDRLQDRLDELEHRLEKLEKK
jgi:membrane-associated protease RseP (regulator of RpoE activity)